MAKTEDVPANRVIASAIEEVTHLEPDLYFREGWESLSEVFGGNLSHVLQTHAAIVLKPDAVIARKVTVALDLLREKGFVPVAFQSFLFTRNMVREFWRQQSADRLGLAPLVDAFLPAAPSTFVILRNPHPVCNAVEDLRLFKGRPKPLERHPGHLRERLQSRYALLNFVHSADNIDGFVRELALFFAQRETHDLLTQVLQGADCGQLIEAYAEQLYRAYPAHDLCFESSLRRIIETCTQQDSRDPRAAGELLLCADRLLGGASTDWRCFLHLVHQAGYKTDVWDRVTVGAALLQTE